MSNYDDIKFCFRIYFDYLSLNAINKSIHLMFWSYCKRTKKYNLFNYILFYVQFILMDK